MKIDKKRNFNDFLDRLSRGGMKGVWNYFNVQQRKKKRNIIQLDNTRIEAFKNFWESLY